MPSLFRGARPLWISFVQHEFKGNLFVKLRICRLAVSSLEGWDVSKYLSCNMCWIPCMNVREILFVKLRICRLLFRGVRRLRISFVLRMWVTIHEYKGDLSVDLRICRLLFRGLRPPQERGILSITVSKGEESILNICEIWSTLSLQLLPDRLRPRGVLPVWIPSMRQIDTFKTYMYSLDPCAKNKKILTALKLIIWTLNGCNSLFSRYKITWKLFLCPFKENRSV